MAVSRSRRRLARERPRGGGAGQLPLLLEGERSLLLVIVLTSDRKLSKGGAERHREGRQKKKERKKRKKREEIWERIPVAEVEIKKGRSSVLLCGGPRGSGGEEDKVQMAAVSEPVRAELVGRGGSKDQVGVCCGTDRSNLTAAALC